MAGEDFKRLYLGEWPAPDPVYLRAVALWLEYYVDCDAFDGTRGPVAPWLRSESIRFARDRREQLRRAADAERIPLEVLLDAKKEAGQRYDGMSDASAREFIDSVPRLNVGPPPTFRPR